MTDRADDTISVAEFAEMHDMATQNVHLILSSDAKLPDDQRRIPGAYKVGTKYRGEWHIPRASAEAFVRGNAGRPKRNNSG